MKYLFFITIAIAICSEICAGDDYSKEVFKVRTLRSSLFMLQGAGGNITASVGPDGVLLVDDGFGEMGVKLLSKLKELGGASPRFVINTHFHYDHTGGNKILGSTATIIAASEVRDRLASMQKLWGKEHPAAALEALPNITFEQSLTLHFNSDKVRVIHFAHGHTDGDSVVFFDKAKVISMGDLYFSGMYPIFHPEHQGNIEDLLRNIKLILNEVPSDAQIVPGHGPLSTKTELERYYNMIQVSVATVRAGIQKELTLKQIQKSGLASEWESFSHGYLPTDKWLALIYKSLKN